MRPRKHNRHLPPCVYLRHGTYYLVQKGKWIRLSRDYSEALTRYARICSAERADMPALLDAAVDMGDVSDNTRKQYKVAARKLKHHLIEFAADQVQPHHINKIMEHYADRPNMANRMRTLLKLAFRLACRRGLRNDNPIDQITPYRERKRTRYLSDDEWHAIYAKASPALRCIMDMAYYTGQRIGDVLAIRLSDVTDEGIYFEPQKTRKHGKRVLVESTDELRAAVERSRALFSTTPMYLLGQRNGHKRSYYAARDLLRRAAKKAGVTNVRWHDIRAKSLTDADAEGKDAQILGCHSTEAQTVRYLRGRKVPVAQGPGSIGARQLKQGRGEEK